MKHEVTTALNFYPAVTPFLNSLHVIIACKHNVEKNVFLFLLVILYLVIANPKTLNNKRELMKYLPVENAYNIFRVILYIN